MLCYSLLKLGMYSHHHASSVMEYSLSNSLASSLDPVNFRFTILNCTCTWHQYMDTIADSGTQNQNQYECRHRGGFTERENLSPHNTKDRSLSVQNSASVPSDLPALSLLQAVFHRTSNRLHPLHIKVVKIMQSERGLRQREATEETSTTSTSAI